MPRPSGDDPSLLAHRIDTELGALSDPSVATVRKTRRQLSSALRQHPADEVLAASLQLFERYNHRWVAYELLLCHPGAFALVGLGTVERLAGNLGSWGEVDQFGVLVAGPAWRAGQTDDAAVHQWASRPDRWWRRAGLVATVPLNVRSQGGRGDVSRTLGVCALLVDDRDDMVTKAMSWALRWSGVKCATNSPPGSSIPMSIWSAAVCIDRRRPHSTGVERSGAERRKLHMRKLILNTSVSLDGVMQAPGRPDEDPRRDFEHGGWATSYFDSVMASAAAEGFPNAGGLLFGRRTYEDFYAVWPNRTDNPFTAVLDNTHKYVASTTLKEPLAWVNSTLLKGDAAEAVARLKEQPGKDIVVLGSGELLQSLMRHNLIDEYVLLIHPLILGAGRRLFNDGGAYATLRLVDSKTTTTGVVMATYQRNTP